jgi:hypothetical protein
MSAGRWCNGCGADLNTKDYNERISMVPQIIGGLWPVVLDMQDQLDFCSPTCAAAWFAKVKKDRPRLLKAEAKRDAEVTGKALAQADRRREIVERLSELPGEDQAIRAAVPDGSSPEHKRIDQERQRLVRELHENGGGRTLLASSSAAATTVAGSRGPRARSGKTPSRR